jgi:hypothetical protein
MDLDKWDMTVLNNLVKYSRIERDNFDIKSRDIVFGKKGDKERLEHHICGMANTVTGILCLGVDNPKSPRAEFTPNGFRRGTESDIEKSIRGFQVLVDPIPKVTPLVLTDEARNRFYMIVKVQGLETQRPYMIKDKGQIWVRIRDSTTPACRTTIANLFVNQLERRNSVRKLQVHCKILRSELIQTAEVIDRVDREYTGIIPPLDLQPFRDAVSSAEWFLNEQDLLGQVNTTGPTVGGLYTNLHEFNALNTTIDIFNNEQMNRGGRYAAFSIVFDRWKTERKEFKEIVLSLEDIVHRCGRFLELD